MNRISRTKNRQQQERTIPYFHIAPRKKRDEENILHLTPYHTLQYHTITRKDHTTLCHTMKHHTVPYHTVCTTQKKTRGEWLLSRPATHGTHAANTYYLPRCYTKGLDRTDAIVRAYISSQASPFLNLYWSGTFYEYHCRRLTLAKKRKRKHEKNQQ